MLAAMESYPGAEQTNVLVLHAQLRCGDAGWCSSVERSLAAFPVALQQRILRYRKQADRCARILDKWMLLRALRLMGVANPSIDSFRYDAQGRPHLEGLGERGFSLSHAGEKAVCAVTRTGAVGIDVERVREIRSDEFERFLPTAAWERFCAAGKTPTAFFREWTQMEAVAKADGRGLSEGLRGMESDGRRATLAGTAWFLREVVLDAAYACHVATLGDDPCIAVQAFSWESAASHDTLK
jgi:4'-phosphopantetheinyl transferase